MSKKQCKSDNMVKASYFNVYTTYYKRMCIMINEYDE